MRAREKLNSVYFGIAAFSAGCLGVLTNSIITFVISLAIITCVLLQDGMIRPNRKR